MSQLLVPTDGAPARDARPTRARLVVYEENVDGFGGNHRYIHLLLQYGPRAGIEVVLVTPRDGAFAAEARRAGPVIVLGSGRTADPYPVRCAKLARQVRRLRPDAVLCNNTRSLGTGLVAARLAGAPVLWYVKTETRTSVRNVAFGLAASRILAISRSVFDRPTILARRSVHVPIGIELDRFATIPPPRTDVGLRALVLSRLQPYKGIDALLDALDRLGSGARGIHVVICGGPAAGFAAYAEEITARAAAMRHATVIFEGWRDDVAPAIAEADAVVLTSRTEGVSRSLVEAMAAGRPVLATRVGGLAELITPGQTGLLVAADDRDAIGAMLVWLRDHPVERRAMGERARAEALSRYDIVRHVELLRREVVAVARRG